MDQGMLQGIGTIMSMLAFLGVCWWAFRSDKKKDFEEAARLPFTESELASQKDSENRQNEL